MSTEKSVQFSVREFTRITGMSTEVLVEIVEEGIVEPGGENPENWRFDTQMLCVVKKASRLHDDLDIDWNGIALVLELLDRMQTLHMENESLRQRLGRFLQD